MKRYPANFDELVLLTEGPWDVAKQAASNVGKALRPSNLYAGAKTALAKAPGTIAKAAGGLIQGVANAGNNARSVRSGGIGGLVSATGKAITDIGASYIAGYENLEKQVVGQKVNAFFAAKNLPNGLPRQNSKITIITADGKKLDGLVTALVAGPLDTATIEVKPAGGKGKRTYVCKYGKKPLATGVLRVDSTTISEPDIASGAIVTPPESGQPHFISYDKSKAGFTLSMNPALFGYIEATSDLTAASPGAAISGTDVYTGETISGSAVELIKNAPLLTGKTGDVWKISIPPPK